jgi:hypothetical protein
MEEALKGQPVLNFPVPSGIVEIAYDPGSNKPATKISANTRMEPFPWYALPKEAEISAAPRSLNPGLLTPIVESQPQSPLTEPSNLPPPPPVSPVSEAPPDPAAQPYTPSSADLPDYGGLPNDYPTEPQAQHPNRPQT